MICSLLWFAMVFTAMEFNGSCLIIDSLYKQWARLFWLFYMLEIIYIYTYGNHGGIHVF